MKILLTVEFYNPNKGGAQKVVEDLARGLVERGHDVTVATTFLRSRKFSELNGVKIESFKIRGNTAEGIIEKSGEVKRYQHTLLNGGFDVLFNYAAQSWPTDLTFSLLKKIDAVKILAPVGYSRFTAPNYKKYFDILPGYLREYDALVYHSHIHQDKKYGDENGLGYKSVIISNGALKREFMDGEELDIRKRLNIRAKNLIINVSHHNVNKGHRFVISAFRKMHRSDAMLLIVGDRTASRGYRRIAHFVLDYLHCLFSSLVYKNIRLVDGRNRELVLSAYKSADLHLFGSRFECAPLVMYESFAAKTVFITTDVGNVRECEDYLKIISTPDEMAKEANHLLDNPDERYALSKEAHDLWKEKYSIESIIGQYEELFLSFSP